MTTGNALDGKPYAGNPHMGGRAVAIVLGACLLGAFGASGRNLVKNPDLTMTDGMGGVVGWSARIADGGALEARPTGDGVVEVSFAGADRSYYRQAPLTLKSGGRYRMRAEVRTAGLGGAKLQVIIWDSGWHRQVETPPFPDDTKGEWQAVEWKGELMRSDKPDGYSMAIAGDGGSAGKLRVEVRNLTLEALTAEADAVSIGYPDSLLEKLPTRIVPIDPLLSKVSAATGEMTFYWPCEPTCGVAACTLHASLDGKPEITGKLGADGRLKVAFGRMKSGPHRVTLRVTSDQGEELGASAYTITACRRTPTGPEGRRLNNFVTELVKQPLADGEVRFFRPTDGWVWISFGEADARGYLDGCAVPAVHRRCGERLVEAMRDVRAGWHTLKVAGAPAGATLRIHALKTVAMTCWPLRSGPCDFSAGYKFSFAFSRRFLLPSMNTANGATPYIQDPFSEEVKYYAARGFGIFGGVGIKTSSPMWFQPKEQWERLTEGDWRLGYDVSVDESHMGGPRIQQAIFAENVWKMVEQRPAQRVNIYWGDATQCWYNDPKVHASELLAIANTGNGRGVALPETYAPVLRTAEETEKWMQLFAKQVASIAEMAPAAKDMTVFNVSPWINLGHWSDYPCPEGDIKAHFARMIHAFATRPEFAANSGIAAGAATAAEEEIRRWIARLFRYHAIEGGTENLAERFGFRWAPGIVKNCDFDEGFNGWEASPAAEGTLRAERIDRYGLRIQGRKKVPKGTGDCVAEFTTSAADANRLSQRLTGLEPGRLYALMFCAPNMANLTRATAKPLPLAFSARLEGGEELAGLRFLQRMTCRYVPRGSKENEKLRLAIYRYVFRATAREATLVFEDRADDGSALKPGAKQVLNYIVFRPYYTETPDEAQEIIDLVAGN